MKKIFIDSLYYKTKDWEYEQEHRMVAFNNDNNMFHAGPEEEGKFLHVLFPLNAVKEITIGPLADKLVVNRCVELIRNELYAKVSDLKPFDVKISKLQIR